MPTPKLMCWIKSQRRWTKMRNNKRYYVSCRQLGCPETMEGSIREANAWWRARETELNAASLPSPRTPRPGEDIAAALLGSATTWPAALAAFFRELATIMPAFGQTPAQPRGIDENDAAIILRQTLLPLIGRTVLDNEPLPERLREHLPPARLSQLETAIKGIRGEQAAEPERTVSALATTWLAGLEKRVAAGQLTVARVNNMRMALAHFVGWLGENADVNGIDAAKLQGFYEFCLTKIAARRADGEAGWSTAFARDVFAVARTFVRWLVEQNVIDPPRNLAGRFRFGSTAKEISTWTIDEVRFVIGEAPGKLKLALLLMLNIGATQADVANLADHEVDWEQGTITRRRSKARNYANAPVTCYRLWPIVFELLQKHRSGDAKRVLLTASGKPFVRCEMVNGKLRKADGFTSCYAHLKRRLGFAKPLKGLRKTGATLLDQYDPSGTTATLYLGHSPRTVKDRFYSRPDQTSFNRALDWLGQRLGFVGD